MGQVFAKTCDRMNNWKWDNPHAFGDQNDGSNPQTTSSGKVKCTGEHVSWYGRYDLRAKCEPSSCRQYKPGDFLAVRPLNWNGKIDEDDDDEIWADPRPPSSARSRPSNGNDNDDSEDEEDRQGGEKETRKEKGTMKGKGKGQGKRKGKGRGKGREKGSGGQRQWRKQRGRGRETVTGKVLLNKPHREMISLVPLFCSRRMKCMRQTPTRRANWMGSI